MIILRRRPGGQIKYINVKNNANELIGGLFIVFYSTFSCVHAAFPSVNMCCFQVKIQSCDK